MRVAVVQMNSRDDKTANWARAETLLAEAGARGVELAVLPELWSYLGPKERHPQVAELDLDYQEKARKEIPSLAHRRSDLFSF
jgi:predicted amidohydrolase